VMISRSWKLPAKAVIFLVFVVLCLSFFVNAQGVDVVTPVPEAEFALLTSVAQSVATGAITAFNQVIALANKAIDGISGNAELKNYGKKLTLMLASIVMVWSIIKNIALKQSLPQLVGDMVLPLVITAFVLTAGLDVLPGVIKSTTATVAGLFGAGNTGGMENSFTSAMFTSMGKIWNAKSSSSSFSFLSSPLDTLAILLLRIGIILVMLMATALGVAAILVAKFQIALAMGLAGLFIPWILFKPTEFLFSGWLNFFLKAGFGLVGVFAVSAVTIAGANGMAALITKTNSDVVDVLTFAAMGAMSVIFAYLMLKGSDIGEGIIGGSATGIGQLASVAKGGAAMAAPRMAGAAAGAAGSGTRAVTAGGAGKLMGSAGQSGMGGVIKASIAGRSKLASAAFDAGSKKINE
jgi:type IV secretion system protein TrbL